jgi:hypothetical protein
VTLFRHNDHKIFKSAGNDSAHTITIKPRIQKKRPRGNKYNHVQGKSAVIGGAPSTTLVPPEIYNNLFYTDEFNEMKANKGEFGQLIAQQLKVTSDPRCKAIILKYKANILNAVKDLPLYKYEWKDPNGNLTGNIDAGPMADELWLLGQEIGYPLVTFHDGTEVKKLDELQNRSKHNKHLVVNTNALNAINLKCIQELEKYVGESVSDIVTQLKEINKNIKSLHMQVQKNVKDITNLDARLKTLEDTTKKKQYHPFRIVSYNNTKGIIFLAVDYEESKVEAEKNKKYY